MKITPAIYAQALSQFAEGKKPAEVDSGVKKFVGMLSRQGKLKSVKSIIPALERFEAKKSGRSRICITIPEISSRTQKEITHALDELYGKDAYDVEIIADPQCIGGMKFSAHDTLTDATIARQLERLRAAFRS